MLTMNDARLDDSLRRTTPEFSVIMTLGQRRVARNSLRKNLIAANRSRFGWIKDIDDTPF